MTTRRQRQVAELIHRELSLLLLYETRDPRLVGVTITGTDVTADLLLARIHFSVMGGAEREAEALAGFEHARGFLRSQLAARLELRFVPDLSFHVDRSGAYAQRIGELLDQLAESAPPDDELETD